MTDNPPTHGSRTPADEELARLRRQAFGPGAPETDPESTAVRMPAVGADAPPPPTPEDEAPDDVAQDPAQTSPGENSPVEGAPVEDVPVDAGGADAVAGSATADHGVDADPPAVDASPDGADARAGDARADDAPFDDAPADATRDDATSDSATAAVPAAAGTPDAAGEDVSSSAGDDRATAVSSDAASAEAAEQAADQTGDQAADQTGDQAADHAGEQTSDGTGVQTADPTDSDPEPTAGTPADPEYSPHDTSDFTPLFAETRAARERGSSAATATSADEAGASAAVGAGADTRTDADDGEATTSTAIPVVAGAAGSSTASPARDLPDTWSSSAPQDAPHRRGAGTHIWVLLVSLVLIPVAWYLLADGGARLTAGTNTSWATGDIQLAHVGELAAGAVLAVLAILLVRVSASGAWLWGAIATVLGAAWVAVPGPLADLITPVLDGMRDLAGVGSIGENMADHLIVDGTSGRLLLYGLALLAIALTVGGARRSGRAEGEFDAEERRATASRV